MQKIKNIEFLRMVDCIAIIFYHLFDVNHLGRFGNIDLSQKFDTKKKVGVGYETQ